MAKPSTDYSLDRGLPASPEAEKSILGAILLDNDLHLEVLESLRAEHFFLDAHRRIYQRIAELSESNRPIDIVTLTEELLRYRELEAVGGAGYLASLTDGVPRRSSLAHYVRIVIEKFNVRAIIHSCNATIMQGLEQTCTADELVAQAEESIAAISDQGQNSRLQPIGEIARESFADLDAMLNGGDRVRGLNTHFVDFDALTCGLQRSDLIIIAARPSVGKTAFAMNIAENVAIEDGKRVAVFSLEMAKEALLTRMMCSYARVDAHRMRSGFLGRDDKAKLMFAMDVLIRSGIHIDDTPALSLGAMRTKARRMAMEKGGLDLVVVDYLQLMTSGSRRTENRTQEVSAISRGLKAIAKELKVPVVALSQLSRSVEGRGSDTEPRLSDLRESGSIEQDADVVAFIHRPEMYKRDEPEWEGKAKLIVAKQRNGPTDTIQFAFMKGATRFESLVQSEWVKE